MSYPARAEGLVNMTIYIFYTSSATIVCSRNTVRESSHTSFFCAGTLLWSSATGKPTVCLSDQWTPPSLGWPAGHSHRLRDQPTSPFRLSDNRISAFSPKLQILYCLLKFHAEIWTSSSPHVFSVYGWLLELTSFRVSGNLLILSANGNICHFIHRQ